MEFVNLIAEDSKLHERIRSSSQYGDYRLQNLLTAIKDWETDIVSDNPHLKYFGPFYSRHRAVYYPSFVPIKFSDIVTKKADTQDNTPRLELEYKVMNFLNALERQEPLSALVYICMG